MLLQVSGPGKSVYFGVKKTVTNGILNKGKMV